MNKAINMMLIEDDQGDIFLIREMLTEHHKHISVDVAGCLSAAFELIKNGNIDVILMDLGLPDCQGFETFKRVYEKAGNIPIVVHTGLSDEHLGLQAVNHGAQDYVCKGEISGRALVRIIDYAIERKRMQDELADKVIQLETALAKVRLLEGIIPICMYCKKIRDDRESWQQLEKYITEHSEALFSHSICPECIKEHQWDE